MIKRKHGEIMMRDKVHKQHFDESVAKLKQVN